MSAILEDRSRWLVVMIVVEVRGQNKLVPEIEQQLKASPT